MQILGFGAVPDKNEKSRQQEDFTQANTRV